jgi:hypothetical protein
MIKLKKKLREKRKYCANLQSFLSWSVVKHGGFLGFFLRGE